MLKKYILLFIVFMITIAAGAQSYNMSNTTINTCGGTFYDPGGTGNYTNSQALMTMTICSSSGGPVSLNFTGNPFQVETGFDFLVIYDGPTATGAGLYNSQTAGGTTNPGIITSSGTCLTITWSSDGSVVYSGWQAAIQCPSCTNGIQDGAETGVDCGGPTCPPCPNCFNGIQDGTETGIDCGPSCPNPCHCNDGILSGNETGVDCGGSCGPCPVPCDVQLTYSTPLYNPPPVGGPVYNMSSGTVSTCGGTFYDPQGTGSYVNNAFNTQTFCSSTPGGQLQFVFTQWALETCCDILTIYNGPNTSSPVLFSDDGSVSPGTITSTNGCLTFVWDSDGSVVGAGWTATINCVNVPQPLDCNGGNIVLTAVGQGEYNLVMNNNFDAGSAGTGWNSNVTASFTNPCDPSIDGGTYMWMGSSSPHPRIIETMPLDVSCGGEICFFLDFATQGNASPCEGIDEPDEGVFFEYSINGGATWVTMEYYGPAGVGNSTASGGTNAQMTAWNQYCLPIPPGAESPATLFHWAQTGSSGNANDHWGLDNVTISSLVNCTPYWYDYSHLPPTNDNPVQSTTVSGTTTYNVTYTNGVDACNASLTITLPGGTTANAGPDVTKCSGGPSVTIGANPVSPDDGATYSWSGGAGSGTIDLVAAGGTTTGQVTVSPAVTTTYTLSVTYNGCTDTDDVTVTVDAPPTASNPAPISVDCTSNIPTPDVTVVTTEADDITNPPTVTWISDVSNGGTCPNIVTRTYRVTDACGNFVNVIQTITAGATSTVTMPANDGSTVACPDETNIAPTPPTVVDQCGRTLSLSAPVVSALPTCSGTRTYTYTYTNCVGGTYSWVYTYTVSPPTVTMPANGGSTVACPDETNIAPMPPAVLDQCGRALSISTPVVSALPTCSGNRTYTYTYTNCIGGTYSWVYTYLVSPPTVTMPANEATTVACISAMSPPVSPIVQDNCGRTLTVSAPVISPDPSCGGTKTYSYTYTSCSGATYIWVYTYTFNDNIAPTASNPSGINIAGGLAPAPNPLVVTDEADNCSTPTVIWVNDISDNGICPEIVTRTYSVTDACGNQITVTQLITIGDPFPPTASNPAPVAVECIGDVPAQNSAVVTDEADNGATPIVTWEDDTSDGLTCPQTISRRYRVTDDCGNFIFVTQTITVEDVTAPVFAAAPVAVTVACAADVPAMTNLAYSDNCSPAGTVSGMDVSNGGTCPEIITRTWTYTDACGNSSSTTQTIIVHDLVAPVFAAAPAAVTVACVTDIPAMMSLSYTDNCDTPGIVLGTDVSNGGTCPEIITRTWTYTDACGNSSSTTQTITVHDQVAPVFAVAPSAITVECLADVPAMTNLGYTDNCAAAGSVLGTDGPLLGGTCGGTITRTWTITDACGNTATASQTITVDDNTNPSATNPATITVPGGPAPAPDPLVVIDEADNCSVPVVAFVSESNDGADCPLTITRIYSVTDACGNTINVTHTLLITDPFLPTASNPAPITVECIGDVPLPDINVVTDEADNQGVPTVAFVNDVSNGLSCPQIITRTYSVTDICNNVITITQTITVDDITAPTGTAPAAINVECIGDVPAANIALITDETDNCTAAPVVTHAGDVSNGLSCPESITRTYSITDNCGNVTNLTQLIIVNDITAPTASAPAAIAVECINDVPLPNVSIITNEADNCTVAPIVAHVGDVSDGNTCPETITRTYSITDDCGNMTTVDQTIIVNDVTNPTASNPVAISVPGSMDVPAPDANVVTNEADNCTTNPVVAWVSDVSDGNVCNLEKITRTYSVTDDCGNQILVTQLITILAVYPPIDAGPDQSICLGDNTSLTAVNPLGVPIIWDGNVVNGVQFSPTTTATYTVTADNLGCISTDQAQIVVNELPVVSFMPDTTSGCIPLLVTFTNTTPNSVSSVWTISDGSQLTGNSVVSNIFDQQGCFDVTLTTTAANGCTNSFTATNMICVEAPPNAAFIPSSFSVSTLDTEVSFTNNTTGAVDYVWNFGDESALTDEENPTHIYSEESAQNYLVTLIAMSSMGCIDTAYSTIRIIEELIYYVPNTFTPDGDAFNNTFKPIFYSGFDPYDYTLLIFDRWGEIIFESHNSEVGWDGTYNGVLVQDGTYAWKLEFKSNQNDERIIDVGHVNMLK